MDAAEGLLEGGLVAVPPGRGASALHAKGSHGTPVSGGGLSLSLVEAAYLAECGRLKVRDGQGEVPLEEILAEGARLGPQFEVRHLVYRDFRERGFVVREEPASARLDFSVRPRGATGKAPSKTWVLAVSERSRFEARAALEFAARAGALGKEALAAVVDEEGDITYYAFEAGLKGGKAPKSVGKAVEGRLSKDHVLLAGDAARALHAEDELVGKPLKQLLRLSLIEAAYLCEEGRLTVVRGRRASEPLEIGKLIEHASLEQRDFALRLAAYRALRGLGLLPKTGFKYGAHFRVYDREGTSTHARYLVHAAASDLAIPWPELARAVRLAHGVKKRLVYALVSPAGGVEFLRVKWTRP